MPLSHYSFPRAILHIDGDSFFASCEVAKNPALKGKPVVTGKERGIASSMSYEAKARGVTRAMKLSDIKKICPDVIILPSDYETYSLYSERMYKIVRRYTEAVEEYSIDECFADLTGMRRPNNMSYEDMAIRIQHELNTELGMTFSVGLSVNKVLAKVASKWRKPDGLTIIPGHSIRHYLAKLPVGKVWGIGPNTSAHIQKLLGQKESSFLGGVFGAKRTIAVPAACEEGSEKTFITNPEPVLVTALAFSCQPDDWVKTHFTKPIQEIHRELNGHCVYELTLGQKHDYASISKTKTFTPPSKNFDFIFSQLSKNVENACIKLRRHELFTKRFVFFLKTQEFRYHGLEIKLSQAVATPQQIIAAIREKIHLVHKSGMEYRATGIVLMDLGHENVTTIDLFGQTHTITSEHQVLKAVDAIDGRYGKHTVFLGSSFRAFHEPQHKNSRGHNSERRNHLFAGETARKRIGLPFLGKVG